MEAKEDDPSRQHREEAMKRYLTQREEKIQQILMEKRISANKMKQLSNNCSGSKRSGSGRIIEKRSPKPVQVP